MGKTNMKAKIFHPNTITVDMFGNAFYRQFKYKLVTHARAFSLKPLFHMSKNTGLFISSRLKYLTRIFSYENMCTFSKISDCNIQLPIRRGKIDFEFIDFFVAELEAQRVAELEAYLTASGLNNYELTADEEKALENFEELTWKDFQFDSIFNNIKQGKRLKNADQIKGDIPFVMSGVTNTGVTNYISNPIIMFPNNSLTIDIFGNTFYRNYNFSAGDDTGVYWNDEKNYSENTMLFITSSINKSLSGKYSYGHKLRSSRSKKLMTKLPIKDNDINYDYMKTFITAIKKLVIKDVVKWTDNKLQAYKHVVTDNEQ